MVWSASIPITESKHVYTTANGLLSNQFNFQSGYIDKKGRIYLGSINGFIAFDPETFVENTFLPPVVITELLFCSINGFRWIVGFSFREEHYLCG